MLAQGWLNPIETARARLQEQIGNFLAGRAKLLRLMDSSSLTVQGQARGLYAVQQALELRLQNEITPKLQSISAGVWTASDILTLGGFTIEIIKQINNVNNLERQVGVVPSSGMFDFDTSTMVIGVGALVVLGIMSGVLFGRRGQQV